ncbi:exported hypothetical protein [Candidatus Sulfobium mesophilum]|uniref:Lipoprotein n=1 Tax=Candidatus Sulfobium mesophilum TaxID=2016548 RepID=A0A2U3QDJ0_9BACT|nr:exported hypothetical protein [Candidatus Sulfobium mesophilum]
MSTRLSAPCLKRFSSLFLLALVLLALGGSCVSEIGAKRFSELLHRYPATWDPLAIRELSAAATLPPSAIGKPVTIIVHTAYALFSRDERRSTYFEAKYDLLEYQLSQEVRFITDFLRPMTS